MDEAVARDRFGGAVVARLATVNRDTQPHIVPVTFAVDGDVVYSIIDAKPKRSHRLRRILNIEANPRVSLIVDHFADDWSALWWVRADGVAQIVYAGPMRDRAIELLRAKYPQYRDQATPFGAAVIVTVERWSSWAAADPA